MIIEREDQMTKPIVNPTDALVAAKLGEQELRLIRMAWMLENLQGQLRQAAQIINEKDVVIAAKDAEIARLRDDANEPELPMEKANGHASEAKH